jgi:hypothetical protein
MWCQFVICRMIPKPAPLPQWPVRITIRLSVDYDGEPTEVQKCGFGELNRRVGGGGQVGDHGRYTPKDIGSRLGAKLSLYVIKR